MVHKSKNIEVSDTAFVTCAFRKLNERLSQDTYAKLWENEKADAILKDYIEAVSTEEIDTHCIRNRFFLETFKTLITDSKIDVIINFGAGFSMYPFLLPDHITYIDIDQDNLISYKSQFIREWNTQDILPRRTIEYIGVDFKLDYESFLNYKLKTLIKGKRTFILIEGVLFFLNRTETERLFSFFDAIQHTGDYIGSVSYNETIKQTEAYNRLLSYANKGVVDASNNGFQLIEDAFYQDLQNYRLIDHQDYFSSSKRYNHNPKNAVNHILNEHFYILQKD